MPDPVTVWMIGFICSLIINGLLWGALKFATTEHSALADAHNEILIINAKLWDKLEKLEEQS